ncbi:resuscitation-promoting factor [Auraticoccus monumenti]|uniref:Uncharacterized conserved protein YabE, contains G5 and tandem DUF348 domains n=1 Tax=Auraticoccus monumenti TaxID=675864 RepID=A0A1G6YQL1_9ACTN|nr:resuscitation-promoting factor [Auraticoccus monumenti]SDD91935.1 Uncharacterized conserved protein YabE, contains G5 and tandem DUF348 domains [Auraticoccus monumenti]
MRKLIPLSIAAAAALLATSGAVGYQVLDKTVELSVDGVPTTVTTLEGNVGEVLAQQGIALGEHDLVAPGAETKLSDGDRIAVQFGREVTVEVDGSEQTHWTTATTVGEALAVLAIKAQGADLSTSRSTAIGREGLEFSVDTVKKVELVAGGKTSSVQTTATTVGEVLAQAKVEPDDDDMVEPAVGEAVADGDTITVDVVEVKDVAKKSAIEHETVRKDSDQLDLGTTRVETEGEDGERTVVTTETRENGKVVKKEEKSSKVTREPVDEVVLVGTRVAPEPEPAPAPAPAPAPQRSSGSAGSSQDDSSDSRSEAPKPKPAPKPAPKPEPEDSSSGASAGVWDRLAQCESGGNWSINTGNGYYGGVQFSAQTWKAYGGKGLPHENSKAEQIRIASKLQAAAGWGQWPSCSAKLGLR